MPQRSGRLREKKDLAPADAVADEDLAGDTPTGTAEGDAAAGEIEITDPKPEDIGYAEGGGEGKKIDEAAATADVPVPAPAARSGRRPLRSSRKSSVREGRSSRRKEITPEQRAARKRAVMAVVWTLLSLVAAVGLGILLFLALKDPREEFTISEGGQTKTVRETKRGMARYLYEKAVDQQKMMDEALRVMPGNPDAAEQARAEGSQLLHYAVLAFANQENPDPEDESIGDLAYAKKAFELRRTFDRAIDDIVRLRQEQKVLHEKGKIDVRMAGINKQDLDSLEKQVRAFMANPVDPDKGGEGADEVRLRFKIQVDPMETNLAKIDLERKERERDRTTGAFIQVKDKVEVLVKQRRFGEALKQLDQGARTFPDAVFTDLRKHVLDSATKAWVAARATARNNFEDFRAPGTNDEIRISRLQDAIKALQEVIDTYGADVPEIHDKIVVDAQQMLESFKAKQKP